MTAVGIATATAGIIVGTVTLMAPVVVELAARNDVAVL
jgi:hypothetical protein